MIEIELRLRLAHDSVREPCAWLLGGSEIRPWLEEIARWRLSDAVQNALKLYVMPRRSGVLVALPPDAALELKPAGAAFGRIGARLLLPVDAVLEPSLPLRDLEPLLHHDVSIVHPSLGWVGFGEEQTLALSDLIALPSVSPGRWRAPPSGPVSNERIVSVSLETPVSFDAFFEDEQKDIGALPMDDIPSTSNEPREGFLQELKRRTIEPIARGARALTRGVEGGEGSRNWVGRLDEWANDKLRSVSEELEHLRNKELHRLVDLLESDSEKGLQHALPLGGGTHRGLSPASGHLTSRRVDFQLGALAGGQPLDPWEVPFDIQQKLLSRYRELAGREKRLQRHRRAAYIYAELIGDLDSAAAVLKDGGHYREAAEIYRRHLHKPLIAARTYRAGGYYRQAVAIYEELEMWEDVGDAHLEMEQPSKARAAFERARDEFLASSDRLGASRIVETKLQDVDAALEIVEDGWPDSRQAADCLERQIYLQAREGLHARTEALLNRLDAQTPVHRIESLVACLSKAATSYPNARIRQSAADLSRRKISARLQKVSRDEAVRLLEHLYRMTPEDRLLKRDGSRFLDTKPQRRVSPPRRRGSSPPPELVRSFELSSSVHWIEVTSKGSLFFALGHRSDMLLLYRGNWSGRFELLSWPLEVPDYEPSPRAAVPVEMELDATGHRSVVLRRTDGQELAPKLFAASRDVLEAETVAGDPGWLPRGTMAMAPLSHSWVVLRQQPNEHLILSAYADDGTRQADIADWTNPEQALHLTLACQNQFIVVGQAWDRWSGELLVYKMEQPSRYGDAPKLLSPQHRQVRSGIVGLRVAQPYTRPRVAVTMLEGVALHWLEHERTYVVASDLARPSASMLRNGAMVVLSGRTVRVYRTDAEETVMTSEMELPPQHDNGVDVVPGYAPNQFAILTDSGNMLVYALPSG